MEVSYNGRYKIPKTRGFNTGWFGYFPILGNLIDYDDLGIPLYIFFLETPQKFLKSIQKSIKISLDLKKKCKTGNAGADARGTAFGEPAAREEFEQRCRRPAQSPDLTQKSWV